MREAVAAGAAIVNDVTALEGDPESLAVAAEIGAPVILMHMQGEPQTMQANPTYESAALDIYRSEEHTSELQSLMRISYAVFCLKKKNKNATAAKTNLISYESMKQITTTH